MEFYMVHATEVPGCWDGEFDPYPRDLMMLHTKAPPKNLRVEVRTGRRGSDTVFGSFNVVSPRFLDVLRSTNASGYDPWPIPLVRNGKVLATYYLLRVHGRGGPIDWARSGLDPSVEFATLRARQIFMDESKWDGSDVFLIPDLGIGPCVTVPIGRALIAAGLSGVELRLNTKLTPILDPVDPPK